jgi:hypothetical protein
MLVLPTEVLNHGLGKWSFGRGKTAGRREEGGGKEGRRVGFELA